MLVFVTCVKHPENSQSYDEVWRLLNNTLYSVCSQQDTDFRVIVVCDKQLPLFHHEELINKYTDFVEVDFPGHGEEVINNFNATGNLSSQLDDPKWWERRNYLERDSPVVKKQENTVGVRGHILQIIKNFLGEHVYIKLRSIRYFSRKWRKVRKKNKGKNVKNWLEHDYFHIANVALNKATKLIMGIVIAKKYNTEYVMFFDADDYVGSDVSAYVNSRSGENGWIMTHGYKLIENKIAPIYNRNSICGTGNIFNYSMMVGFIPSEISESSTQEEIFQYCDSEFLFTVGRHVRTRYFFEKQNRPFKDYPFRSVAQLLGHDESSQNARMIIRGESVNTRLITAQKYAKFSPIPSTLVDYFNVLPKDLTRVFCVGFHKTGTTSLDWILQDMGYQVSRHYKQGDNKFIDDLKQKNYSEIKQVSKLFNAFQDAPWFLFYKEFDEWYPNSKFILTIRESASWWKSFLNYFKVQSLPSTEYIYGYENPVGHERVFIDRYEQHNRDVIEYFKDRPDDLLVVDVSEEKTLEKISKFLEKSTSFRKMPHRNAKLRVPNKNKIKMRKNWLKKIKSVKIRSTLKILTMAAPPIIIGGSQFSGKELMLSILSCHPGIHTLSGDIKLNYFNRHPLLPNRSLKEIDPNRIETPIDMQRLNKKLLNAPISFSAKRWAGISKLSVLAYDDLLTYYGKNVRILNMVRDGRDVVTENNKNVMARYALTSEEWVYDVQAGMKFDNHPQVMTVRYEDLMQDYERVIRKISEFIGEDNPVPFIKHPKGAATIMDRHWVGRWQQPQYSERVENLLLIEGAQNLLQHYDYTL